MVKHKSAFLLSVAPVALAGVMGLMLVAGIPLEKIITGAVLYALIAVVLASYVLRLGLIVLVVCGLYRLVRRRLARRRMAVVPVS